MDWFRFYTETIHDRKIRRLPPAQRWLWVTVLAIARSSPEPGRLLISEGVPVVVADLVDAAAITRKDVNAGLQAFTEQNMLTVENGVYVVSHWDERQFSADSSKERVRRYRERKSNGDVTLQDRYTGDTVTPPEDRVQITDPETDLDQENKDDRDTVVSAVEEVAASTEPSEVTSLSSEIDLGLAQVARAFEAEGFGTLSQSVKDQLVSFVSEFGAQWTLMALKEAVLQGKRRLKYVSGVLQNWRAEGGPRLADERRPQARAPAQAAGAERDPRYANFYALFPDS
ncbi:DnaD domain protein [Alicyclobacillus sp. ALC3]|uniref:DnaD domain protein n=1 Tax=Alicyclobacillus sp. ALC3 TaxID=2796143 RepID=UPI0023793319|nr:DnaD domain protein [Alicyclobacillus sp. ALC3]WDL96385.1 DnaD domain protein [Alicyclobacillus sp. ALC3]